MKHVLITGGAGFIFSHVTEYLLERGWKVTVIDNLSAGSHPELIPQWKKEYPNFTFHEADVSFATVAALIERINPTHVVHAAAISDVDYSIKEPTKTVLANQNGTLQVFEAARKLKHLEKLLYVSTDEVYGECDHPKTEDEILFPKNPYALSKAFGSLLRLTYDNTYPELRDKTCETRFCNVFGPRQDTRKVIPAIKAALAGGNPLPLHNEGSGYRQFIHVLEIPPVIELLLEQGTRTYNVTASQGHTVQELLYMAEEIAGRQVPTVRARRSGMDMRYNMSAGRLDREFGWQPKRDFYHSFKEYLLS